MIATIALATALQNPLTAASYFPLNPGDRYVYEEDYSGRKDTFVDTVGDAVVFGDTTAYPVTTKRGSSFQESVFYANDKDRTLVVAFDKDSPLASPYTILKVGDEGQTWSYIGETNLFDETVDLVIEGKSRRIGKKKVMDEEVECLEVTLTATVAPGDVTSIKTTQVAIYGLGIGLVEMASTEEMGRRKSVRKRTLIAYQRKKT